MKHSATRHENLELISWRLASTETKHVVKNGNVPFRGDPESRA